MTVPYRSWAEEIGRLHAAVARLIPQAVRLGVVAPEGREWFDLLDHKLRPQVDGEPLLVVAVVGGTNIGKSLMFNHLAGETASAVSPLAAGTRHPVALVPPGFSDPQQLARLFAGFTLRPWQAAADALSTDAEDYLFWRIGERVPPRLVLLDTPDIDSDAPVNWQRADQVRHVADVLLGVLTQQKYNDAAVKQFFRKAVEADKPVILIFNQVDLEGDRDYWPLWLDTFCQSTGARPELVYVVPHDRALASRLELRFYSVGPTGRQPPESGTSLCDELGQLHFDAIKIRTLRGALVCVLDAESGLPSYLDEVRRAGTGFAAAAASLAQLQTRGVAWPTLPPRLLVDEIRAWWDARRSGWARGVHRFYRTVGEGLTWPLRKAWQSLQSPEPERPDQFFTLERRAILEAVENLIDELDRLATVGNDTLRPRLVALLSGDARARLLQAVQEAHATLPPVDEDYRRFLGSELEQWEQENPRAMNWLNSLDAVLALARPALTGTLIFTGFGVLGGGAVTDVATQAVTHTVSQVAVDLAQAGLGTGLAEAGVHVVGGEGFKHAAARLFYRLQCRYVQMRGQWLHDWLERHLLGDLTAELHDASQVTNHEAYQAAQAAMTNLARLAQTTSPLPGEGESPQP